MNKTTKPVPKTMQSDNLAEEPTEESKPEEQPNVLINTAFVIRQTNYNKLICNQTTQINHCPTIPKT